MPASSVFIPAVCGKYHKSYVVFCIILGFCDCILAGEFWNKTTSRPDARERIACLHQSCHGIDPLPQTPHTFSTDTPKQSINGFSVPDAKDYNDTLSKSLCISKISMSLLRMLQLWTHPDNLTRDTPLFTSCPPPQSRHTGKSHQHDVTPASTTLLTPSWARGISLAYRNVRFTTNWNLPLPKISWSDQCAALASASVFSLLSHL